MESRRLPLDVIMRWSKRMLGLQVVCVGFPLVRWVYLSDLSAKFQWEATVNICGCLTQAEISFIFLAYFTLLDEYGSNK